MTCVVVGMERQPTVGMERQPAVGMEPLLDLPCQSRIRRSRAGSAAPESDPSLPCWIRCTGVGSAAPQHERRHRWRRGPGPARRHCRRRGTGPARPPGDPPCSHGGAACPPRSRRGARARRRAARPPGGAEGPERGRGGRGAGRRAGVGEWEAAADLERGGRAGRAGDGGW